MKRREASLVAGIGCRRGIDAAELLAAVDHALSVGSRSRAELSALAAPSEKRGVAALSEAAEMLGTPMLWVETPALARAAALAVTPSLAARAVLGIDRSPAEAAALAVAGEMARLVVPRTVTGRVTCALACAAAARIGSDQPEGPE